MRILVIEKRVGVIARRRGSQVSTVSIVILKATTLGTRQTADPVSVSEL